jgi:hypothetical protein
MNGNWFTLCGHVTSRGGCRRAVFRRAEPVISPRFSRRSLASRSPRAGENATRPNKCAVAASRFFSWTVLVGFRLLPGNGDHTSACAEEVEFSMKTESLPTKTALLGVLAITVAGIGCSDTAAEGTDSAGGSGGTPGA